jgi:hypothetical protein
MEISVLDTNTKKKTLTECVGVFFLRVDAESAEADLPNLEVSILVFILY